MPIFQGAKLLLFYENTDIFIENLLCNLVETPNFVTFASRKRLETDFLDYKIQ